MHVHILKKEVPWHSRAVVFHSAAGHCSSSWHFNQPQLCGISARSKSVMPGEGGPATGSPRVSRSMEMPLKAGWLKKQQRGLVKNWQQRYFVLRGSTLTQHKDDKETTVQVTHFSLVLVQLKWVYVLISFHWNQFYFNFNLMYFNVI